MFLPFCIYQKILLSLFGTNKPKKVSDYHDFAPEELLQTINRERYSDSKEVLYYINKNIYNNQVKAIFTYRWYGCDG